MVKKLIRKILQLFPAVMQFRINMSDLLDRHKPAEKTPWGFSLAGHDAMAAGTFEPEETVLVRKLLGEVDVLVNVGANVGYYCCHALSMGVPVVAIEPITRNLHYLLTNIRNNGWSQQAEIFQLGIGANANIMEMWGGGTGASLVKGWASAPENYVTHVPILSLDRVLGDTIKGKRALILVDVEGSELMLLRGAAKTLKNDPKPIWMMEITTTEHMPKNVTMNPDFMASFGLFFENGYHATEANSNGNEICQSDINEVVEGSKVLRIHNFIFR